ncbi:hypothetical protein RA27_17955 [Ruegeria sp. ANG-R]|uniref:LemA family protein n=1 Tax=Ruegeria sp. ANG-R TaxID=1577903 RepID=UPI00057DD029|nr:LemA family protein [Ruegeria sp. ANG-R]KIC39040.1 hypothetical protein RA27_17955 [Ruegeria sp. ANG-R]
MTIDAKIASMRDRGILTKDQASRLAESLQKKTGAPTPPKKERSGIRTLLMIFGACAVALILALVFAPQDPDVIQNVSSALNQPEEVGKMNTPLNRGMSLALFIVVPFAVVLLWSVWIFNSLAEREELVFESWAQVESNYQRRADLIPNVVEAASDYMAYERELLLETTGSRAGSTDTERQETIDELRDIIDEIATAQGTSKDVMDGISGAPSSEATIAKLLDAQARLGASMTRVVALAENYPTLQSGDQVLALQASLEGTENRINVARMRFNEAASQFNSAIRRMPTSLIAAVGDFKRKAYFTSTEGAETAVDINLD